MNNTLSPAQIDALDKVVDFLNTLYTLGLYEHTTRQKYLPQQIDREIFEMCTVALTYMELDLREKKTSGLVHSTQGAADTTGCSDEQIQVSSEEVGLT